MGFHLMKAKAKAKAKAKVMTNQLVTGVVELGILPIDVMQEVG